MMNKFVIVYKRMNKPTDGVEISKIFECPANEPDPG